ncbi:biotin--[acetyl-CoA-carboxylase] ligase [Roseateles violae]|uniref:biotin--[biotin carboxyl-carrier protein] ligase n=1 Tax=Roseateles violae TaxID=3058042 RepID=A0ABT8DK45_9BURK|nr:biotin--[acetyl-CoA-carboxylase] ligase [Pelomonas sp. PFR6]MDN3918762.1 biotin--[acetyl-CoA-carboxylase] ligase [Pelomonas sp. PFR6]
MAANEPTHLNWHVQTLWQQLSPLLPGIGIEVLAHAESTNTTLLERVRSESVHGEIQPYGRRADDLKPCLLIAEHQSHGRGRMGRAWLSSPGASLTFSLGLAMDLADWSGLSLAMGCAIAEALEPLPAGQAPRLQLKWPNDLWLDERKLGGILIETVPAAGQRMAIIGVGLNIAPLNSSAAPFAPAQFGSGFAALDELLPGIDAPGALARLAPALARALLDFGRGGFAAWREAYARRDLTLGRAVTAGALEGISRGVNARGELLLEQPGGALQTIGGGEVSLRLADPQA